MWQMILDIFFIHGFRFFLNHCKNSTVCSLYNVVFNGCQTKKKRQNRRQLFFYYSDTVLCVHCTVYSTISKKIAVRSNWANGWTDPLLSPDPIETKRSAATIPRRSRGDAKRQSPRVTATWSLTYSMSKVIVDSYVQYRKQCCITVSSV